MQASSNEIGTVRRQTGDPRFPPAWSEMLAAENAFPFPVASQKSYLFIERLRSARLAYRKEAITHEEQLNLYR